MSKPGVFFCFIGGVTVGMLLAGIPILITGDTIGGVFIIVGLNTFWIFVGLGSSMFATANAESQQQDPTPTETQRTALAKIETSQAHGEPPNLDIRMDLTIAPYDAPGFRATTQASVNLMDVDAYKAGKLLVVTYDENQPWRITVVKNPKPDWAQRAAAGAIDSAPHSAHIREPEAPAAKPRSWIRDALRSTLAGTAAGLVFFLAIHYW